MILNVRVITSEECPKCKSYKEELDAAKFSYTVFDADAEENQDQLDKWYIDDMPVVQIVDESGNVKVQFPPGKQRIQWINFKMEQIRRKK